MQISSLSFSALSKLVSSHTGAQCNPMNCIRAKFKSPKRCHNDASDTCRRIQSSLASTGNLNGHTQFKCPPTTTTTTLTQYPFKSKATLLARVGIFPLRLLSHTYEQIHTNVRYKYRPVDNLARNSLGKTPPLRPRRRRGRKRYLFRGNALTDGSST